jgi:hypothetical protein
MKRPPEERPQLDGAEQQLVTRLAAHYTPTPLTPSQRAASDAALWARLQKRSRQKLLLPALATVATALLVAWLTVPGLFTSRPQENSIPGTGVVETRRAAPWEYELLYPRELTDTADQDDSAMLPEDYVAIAQVFLDG